MYRFRPFLNSDSPALSKLWNRAFPRNRLVREFDGYGFEEAIAARPGFDAEGLVVALDEGRIVGFVHAGFGPVEPLGPSHALDRELGAIAMLVVDPEHPSEEIANALVLEAEQYLYGRGAKVVYAGGQKPLNPFYHGVYGGGEFAGILSEHREFRRAVESAGYRAVSSTLLYEIEARGSPLRDPRAVALRRNASLEVEEDALLPGWWDAVAIGAHHPTRCALVRRPDGLVLARAWTWDRPGSADPRPPRPSA